MKILITILIVFFSFNILFSETPDVNLDDSIDSISEAKAPVEEISYLDKLKFRGNVSFVWDYMTEYRDGLKYDNNYMDVDYSPLDCTDEDSEYKDADDPGRVIGGSWGGMQAKLYVNYSVIAPLLNFDNPLTKDNNIKFTFLTEISPITANFGGSVTFTPVAFLLFETGFLIGHGWKLDDELAGIGLNNDGIIERKNLYGPHFQLWFSSTFQMDLAFVLPEAYQRWTHVVLLATPMLKYQALLGISEDQPYMYEECPGEQLGGWRFLFELLLGYRFIVNEDDTGAGSQFLKRDNKNFIITVGAYMWLDYLNLTHYYDSPMSNGWGSDFSYVNFGPAVQFDLPYNIWVKLFAFFRNDRAYTDETVGNRDFRDRVYDDYNVFFRWFGFFVGWSF